jgi:phage terminase large subunit
MLAGTNKYMPDARHIGYGGARGGGKSYALRIKFVLLCLHYKNFRALLLRRTMPELRENHIVPLREMLEGLCQYKDNERVFIFPNGSRLKLGYCDQEADVLQYQGQEYDAIGMEEATHFTDYQRTFLTTCNRNTRRDYKPKMYYTSNPGGVGHDWFKRLFIDRQYQNKENPNHYVFIPARVYDNKVLMENNPEYVEALESLQDKLRKMHLDGDWDVFEGQYFSEFSRDKHVIEPFEVPSNWLRYRSVDWGYNDPCAIYWHAVEPGSGRVFTYREMYFNQVIATKAAQMVVEASKNSDGTDEEIRYTVASPDMWQNRGQGITAETIAQLWIDAGVPLIRAKNERVQGWHRMHEWLDISPDGKPYWQIFSTCTNLVRTLPALIHDDNRVEDVSDKSEDHAAESCRYGFMSRPKPIKDAIADLPSGTTWYVSELRMKGYSDAKIKRLQRDSNVKIIGKI